MNSRLPNINILTGDKNNLNESLRKFSSTNINKTDSIKNSQKIVLNKLYKALINNDERSSLPQNSITNYFKKNTKKNIPELILKNGSNIHNIFDEFQDVSNMKNFSNFARLNDMTKRDIMINNNTFNKEGKRELIEKIDDKISKLHFDLAERLIKNVGNDVINE